MARLAYKGLDELQLSMEEIAKIPADVQDQMLNAGADALIPVQQDKAQQMGVYRTGRTARSIDKTSVKVDKDGVRRIHVYAHGSRKRGRRTTRNSEIHFINEFGKKGQQARPFTKRANEAAREAVTQAQLRVYDEWLESLNL